MSEELSVMSRYTYIDFWHNGKTNILSWTIRNSKVQCRASGPFHYRIFACNSNPMETSPCHNSVAGRQIATICCTCHDSTTVVPCTNFLLRSLYKNRGENETKFPSNLNCDGKPLVKRAPDYIAECVLLFSKFKFLVKCWDIRTVLLSNCSLIAPGRGFWSWFGGVCSLTYCNGNFRVTMVSEPFNVIL